ncbi:porin family protein [Sphingomonas ginsenosidivorax]|uniref:Porin family protein n=1 Tax=Sphingomonas ginsenosidivorax TaxID=862135 RepID=A0A5C6UJH1_9SPHN|nr:outer membrane beta-barrel protein [Sphingomonas ginsenosidivorax]TXC72411.1 porin family protein [Sphingomonas ginsenosidivorax]
MRKILVALVATSAFATPVLAQSANPTFSGARVEATLGYDHTGAGSSVSNNNGRDDQKIDGLLYGGGIGYDIATSSNVVLGAEAELTGSTAKSDRNDYTSDFGFGRVKQGRDIYVGARAGYVVAPTTMLYVKGGYTNAKLNVLAGSTSQTTDTRFNLDGWRLGAGAEHAMGPNSYAKLEYRYSNYERSNIDYATGGTSGRFDVDTDRHQVVASYGFRF